jgi:RHS repeat-associated protein
MPGRSFSSGSYRYGFNGMEKDDEVKGSGNSLDFGARIYDSRLGRWLSRDPASKNYPSFSDYIAFGDNPIYFVDPDGKKIKLYYYENGKRRKIVIRKVSDLDKLSEINDDFVKDFHQSVKYLMKDGADSEIIKELIEAKNTIKVKTSADRERDIEYSPSLSNPSIGSSDVGSNFVFKTNTIYWDNIRGMAMAVEGFGETEITKASPAFTLLSEFGKAWFINIDGYKIPRPRNGLILNNSITLVNPLSAGEVRNVAIELEELVIRNIEIPASSILGEGYREKWKGPEVIPYETSGPTSTTPKNEQEAKKVKDFEQKFNN